LHSLVQLLAFAIDSIAADRAIDILAVLVIEFMAEDAKVIVCLTNVLHLSCNKLDDDDVVEITDDGNIVGQDILGIAEIDEHRQESLTIGIGQLPFVISQHLDQALKHRNALGDEIGQGFIAANFFEHMLDSVYDLLLFRIAYSFARLLERLAECLSASRK